MCLKLCDARPHALTLVDQSFVVTANIREHSTSERPLVPEVDKVTDPLPRHAKLWIL